MEIQHPIERQAQEATTLEEAAAVLEELLSFFEITISFSCALSRSIPRKSAVPDSFSSYLTPQIGMAETPGCIAR